MRGMVGFSLPRGKTHGKNWSTSASLRDKYSNHVVEPPFGERLLFGSHAHVEQLLDRRHPAWMGDDEGVVAQCVLRPLDVDRGQGMSRIFKAEVDNVLRGDAQELRARHAEETVHVRGAS